MVAATYDAAMVRVFADEGGYTNDPRDPGGPTNWGITIYDARKYWKRDATAADVKAMPRDVAVQIYKMQYAAPIHYDELPAGFDYSVLDAGINSGLGRAIPWAGRALGTNSVTIEPIVQYAKTFPDKVKLIQAYWQYRVSFLHGLSTWSHFGAGWGRRCASGEAAAVKMWLNQGQLTSGEVVTKMNIEAKKAADKTKNAATSATASTVPASASILDWSHLGGKIALAVFLIFLAGLVLYFVRQAILHNQRANAYTTA